MAGWLRVDRSIGLNPRLSAIGNAIWVVASRMGNEVEDGGGLFNGVSVESLEMLM